MFIVMGFKMHFHTRIPFALTIFPLPVPPLHLVFPSIPLGSLISAIVSYL